MCPTQDWSIVGWLQDGVGRPRYKSLQDARVELERLYGKRVDDSKIDLPEFQQLKEECLAGIRQAEGAVTSYHGSVRSIKAVVETRMHIIVWVALSLKPLSLAKPLGLSRNNSLYQNYDFGFLDSHVVEICQLSTW